jgi:hypothetical protein
MTDGAKPICHAIFKSATGRLDRVPEGRERFAPA